MSLRVICVLKSGGDFNWEYVEELYKGSKRCLGTEFFKFCCFTDIVPEKKSKDIAIIPLEDDLEGWWSKIEIFKMKGQVIYFDLDTVLLGDLSDFSRTVENMEEKFLMLRPFRKTELWASGVMAWSGDYFYLHENFDPEKHIPEHEWDQRYITSQIKSTVFPIQILVPNIYSYKKHCKDGVPADAQIVCFHGKPRPHEVELNV